MIVSIIPARGGSKGIPRKNLVELAGHPLIYYSTMPSLRSVVDRTIVSTEDPEIKEVSLELGAEVVDRPMALAGDMTPTEPVVRHCIEFLQLNDDDLIVLLQPTSPIRTYHTINDCVVTYSEALRHGHDSIFTAHTEKYYHWCHDGTSWMGRGFDYMDTREPRQNERLDIRENGNVYVNSVYNFINHNRFGVKPAPYITGPILGMELDAEWQIPMLSVILDRMNEGEVPC